MILILFCREYFTGNRKTWHDTNKREINWKDNENKLKGKITWHDIDNIVPLAFIYSMQNCYPL